MGETGRGKTVMGERGRTPGGWGWGREAGTGVKDAEGTETRGRRHSESGKFRPRWWRWTQRLVENGEVAPRGWGWVRTTLEPRTGLEPRPSLRSYSPRALRPPPSQRPAARASSARHRPAARPSAVAPPPPCPLRAGPAPSRLQPGPRGGGRGEGGAGRTRPHLDRRCVGARPSGPVSSRRSSPLPQSRAHPAAAAGRRGGRAGAGLAGAQLREGAGGGGGGGRSPLPQPAQGWKRPSTGLVQGGVTAARWGVGLGQREAAQPAAKTRLAWQPLTKG